MVRNLSLMLRRADLFCSENYTPAQRSQHLIQTDPKVYGQYYMANCSSVDGATAFRGGQSDNRHIDYFQSFESQHEDGLPTKLPAVKLNAVENELRGLIEETQTATTADTTKDAKRRLGNTRRRLLAKRLREYQYEWYDEREKWKITSRGKESTNDPLKEDIVRALCELIPERKRFSKAYNVKRNPQLS